MTPVARLRRAVGGVLALRMIALSLLLLLAVQLAGFAVVRQSIERNARQALEEELEVGARVWERLLEQRRQKLTQGATLLAADYGFLSAVHDGDLDTVRSALDNAGARIRAAVTVLLDDALTLRAAGEQSDPAALRLLPALTPQLAAQGHTIADVDGRPYQFVMVRTQGAGAAGWVVTGFAVDRSLLDDMRAVSRMDVALLADAGEAEPRVVLATLARLPARLEIDALSHRLVVDGDDHQTRSIALAPGLSVLLLRSVDAALARYRSLETLLAGITLAGVVLFGLGSVAAARQVTRPLHRLALASERLGQGAHAVAMTDTTRRDEIGDLARTFEAMRQGIVAQQQEIRHLAYTDRLTGLPNRARFREAVQHAIASAPAGVSVAVVMLDLDRFKQINDVLGYAGGDRVLRSVAERLLRQAVRASDVVGRLGGDEFALLLPTGDTAAALGLARRVVGVFEEALELDEQLVDLSAGIGIACWPQHADDVDTLLSRAEIAMYGCKRTSEPLRVYDPALDARGDQTLSLLSELRRALEQGELRLFLQPKVALDDARLVGAEGLLRWQHPQRGLVAPAQFIPFAEQTGFVRRLTLWAFEQAARSWNPLQRHGRLSLSINLSARDLLDLELPRKLSILLARHGAPAAGFCLEITESAIMDDPVRTAATVQALDRMGFELSIDDFGTGYSSLAYLRQLPVRELKIDKSFVGGMERDDGDAKIVRSTIDLAHNLGLRVVAEGVENAAMLAGLRQLRCDVAQGYHLGRPMALADFDAWAAEWRATVATSEVTEPAEL